jgi:hypothetical protein
MNQSAEYSMKRNCMKLELSLNIPPEYPLDTLHRRPELILQSRGLYSPAYSTMLEQNLMVFKF